jgi:hypothetical protein
MRKIILFIPILLFSSNLMHPDDPKSRNHNSLGFGVTGDVVVSGGVFYVGQTGSSLNNGSIYIYTPNALNGIDQEIIIAPINHELGFDFGSSGCIRLLLKRSIGINNIIFRIFNIYIY